MSDFILEFKREAYEMAKQAIISNYALENAALELNALKFAFNMTFKEVREAIVPAYLACIDVTLLATSTQKVWNQWAPLLSKFTFKPAEQLHLLSTIAEACQKSASAKMVRSFQLIVPILYKVDVIEEESVLSWFYANRERKELAGFCKQLQSFVTWLQENDSEDDDSGADD